MRLARNKLKYKIKLLPLVLTNGKRDWKFLALAQLNYASVFGLVSHARGIGAEALL
jgi:hypothetical protein